MNNKLITLGLGCVLLLSITSTFVSADTIERGKALYAQRCVACHSIGKGRLVGPDLKGVSQRRSESWLIAFIKSPMTLVKQGDKAAVQLLEEYNNMPMPDQNLSDDEIRFILEYINSVSSPSQIKKKDASKAKPVETTKDPVALKKEIELGKALFQGTQRFSNKGPSCISCHHVDANGVDAGGSLAADLTSVSSRMGRQGVKGVLQGMPFPAMKASYQSHPLTDPEIDAVATFLDELEPRQGTGCSVTSCFLIYAVLGCVVLLIVYGLMWRRRKKRSINQDLFDRQISSKGESE